MGGGSTTTTTTTLVGDEVGSGVCNPTLAKDVPSSKKAADNPCQQKESWLALGTSRAACMRFEHSFVDSGLSSTAFRFIVNQSFDEIAAAYATETLGATASTEEEPEEEPSEELVARRTLTALNKCLKEHNARIVLDGKGPIIFCGCLVNVSRSSSSSSRGRSSGKLRPQISVWTPRTTVERASFVTKCAGKWASTIGCKETQAKLALKACSGEQDKAKAAGTGWTTLGTTPSECFKQDACLVPENVSPVLFRFIVKQIFEALAACEDPPCRRPCAAATAGDDEDTTIVDTPPRTSSSATKFDALRAVGDCVTRLNNHLHFKGGKAVTFFVEATQGTDPGKVEATLSVWRPVTPLQRASFEKSLVEQQRTMEKVENSMLED